MPPVVCAKSATQTDDRSVVEPSCEEPKPAPPTPVPADTYRLSAADMRALRAVSAPTPGTMSLPPPTPGRGRYTTVAGISFRNNSGPYAINHSGTEFDDDNTSGVPIAVRRYDMEHPDRAFGLQIDAEWYIEHASHKNPDGTTTYLTPQEQRRLDVVTIEGSLAQSVPVHDKLSAVGTVRVGARVDGNLGLRAVQEEVHELVGGSARTGDALPRSYPHDNRAAVRLGADLALHWDYDALQVGAGASLTAELGSSGINTVGPFAYARYDVLGGRVEIEASIDSHYQVANDPARTSWYGGQASNVFTNNVALGVTAYPFASKKFAVGYRVESDPKGLTSGFGDRLYSGSDPSQSTSAIFFTAQF